MLLLLFQKGANPEFLPGIIAHAKHQYDSEHPDHPRYGKSSDDDPKRSLTKTESAKDNVEDVVGDNTPGDAPEPPER